MNCTCSEQMKPNIRCRLSIEQMFQDVRVSASKSRCEVEEVAGCQSQAEVRVMKALIRVADRLKVRRVEIRFFSESPKGEMRHADAIAVRIHVHKHHRPLSESV